MAINTKRIDVYRCLTQTDSKRCETSLITNKQQQQQHQQKRRKEKKKKERIELNKEYIRKQQTKKEKTKQN